MIAVDTNILVRYFVGAEDDDTRKATRFVEQDLSIDQLGYVTSVAICEVIWVIKNYYKFGYAAQAAVIRLMLDASQLLVEHEDCVASALESQHGDIADAIIHFVGVKQGCSKTLTFDKKFARLSGVELLQ